MKSGLVKAILTCSVLLFSIFGFAGQQKEASSNQVHDSQSKSQSTTSQQNGTDTGEHLFQVHCARCHHAPEQIPARIAGTVLRHMRERAILTPDDERALLKYLAP